MNPINVSAASSSIDVTAGQSTVEIEVSAGQVDVDVIGGQGPQGPTGPQGPPGESGASSWNDLEDIPADFPPQAHTHAAGDIDSESAAAGYVLTANGEGGATWEESSGGGASSWDDLSDRPAVLTGGYFAVDGDDFLCLRSLNMSNPIRVETTAGSFGGFQLYSLDFYDPETAAFSTQTTAWTGTVDVEDITGLAAVATSNSYDDLDDLPALFSGSYDDLSGLPTLFSGSYNDLTDKPPTYTRLSDTVSNVSYIGLAPTGSATSASVWRIKRTTIATGGTVSASVTATNVAWNDRLTASYS